ncbi:MAG: hypothetical protein ACLRZL_01065 [Alistipes communis]
MNFILRFLASVESELRSVLRFGLTKTLNFILRFLASVESELRSVLRSA